MSETRRLAGAVVAVSSTRSVESTVSSPGGVGRTNRGLAHLVRGERMTIILDREAADNGTPALSPIGQSRPGGAG